MDYACSQCGHRQDPGPVCTRCGSDTVHDLSSQRTRDLFEEIDARLRDRLEGRIRFGGVVIGMVVVIAAWFIPGYWALRGAIYPGLPMLADQILFMIGVALLAIKLLERNLRSARFPYLASLPPASRP